MVPSVSVASAVTILPNRKKVTPSFSMRECTGSVICGGIITHAELMALRLLAMTTPRSTCWLKTSLSDPTPMILIRTTSGTFTMMTSSWRWVGWPVINSTVSGHDIFKLFNFDQFYSPLKMITYYFTDFTLMASRPLRFLRFLPFLTD